MNEAIHILRMLVIAVGVTGVGITAFTFFLLGYAWWAEHVLVPLLNKTTRH